VSRALLAVAPLYGGVAYCISEFRVDGNNTIGIGELATLITAAAAIVYVLGLLAVSWPIFARITNNPIDTWYAVSLIPKTIVAGQGVRILLQYPLVVTFFYGLVNMVMSIATDVALLATGSLVVRLVVKIIFLVLELLIILTVLLQPQTRWVLGSVADAFEAEDIPSSLIVLTYALFLLLLGPVLYVGRLFRDAIVVKDLQLPPQIIWNGTSIFHAVLFLFLISFFIALPAAMVADPPLPTVEITTQSDDSNDVTVTGHLVAHTDGVWHFFDEENTLISLRDDKVDVARVRRMKAPRLATNLSRVRMKLPIPIRASANRLATFCT
jgi:hypothetical protein